MAQAKPVAAAYRVAEGPSNQTTLSQAYRTIIGYFNTVGLRSKDPPFLCSLVAQRRAL